MFETCAISRSWRISGEILDRAMRMSNRFGSIRSRQGSRESKLADASGLQLVNCSQRAREIMPTIRQERERFCPYHGVERQIAIKMWKKSAAARGLEAHAIVG